MTDMQPPDVEEPFVEAVQCSRCGRTVALDSAVPEEGDEWECQPCNRAWNEVDSLRAQVKKSRDMVDQFQARIGALEHRLELNDVRGPCEIGDDDAVGVREIALDAKQLDIIRLQEELEFQRKDAQRYHEAMTALKRSKMEHGLCEPIERHACTACAAIRTLERMASEYKGSRIILA